MALGGRVRLAAIGVALAMVAGTLSGVAGAVPAAASTLGSSTAGARNASGLAAAFDNVGITTAASPSAGDFDGIGDSFPAAGLAADGLTPGGRILHDGLRLRWPDVVPGRPDNVVADGQTISVGASGNTLAVVGASAYGTASGTLVVHYSDGTTAKVTLNLADWINSSPAPGTDFLATAAGWNPGGTIPVSLSYVALPIDPSKTVASVTLPVVSKSVGAGVNSMHIFDLAIGTVAPNAAGGPGTLSHYDLSRKDCLGTAADTASKVWYTVAGGRLSDVYSPTVDNTNVHTLDYLVTNGSTFTDLQPRNMTYTVRSLGTSGMSCQVTSTADSGAYRIVTDYITDPWRAAVVMKVVYEPLVAAASRYKLYVRLNPLLNGHGGGGSSNAGAESATVVSTPAGPVPVEYSTNSLTNATNRSYAQPMYMAMAASSPFRAVSNGYVGSSSDGLTQLDAAHRLTTLSANASNGNIVTTAELHLSRGRQPFHGGKDKSSKSSKSTLGAYGAATNFTHKASCTGARGPGQAVLARMVSGEGMGKTPPGTRSVTLTLGFAPRESAAVHNALAGAATPYAKMLGAYQRQWRAYDRHLCRPPASIPGLPASEAATVARRYWLSANVIKASVDKTFPGAIVASLSSPWGQAVSAGSPRAGLAPFFGSYREVWARDAYQAFTAFLLDGDLGTARSIVDFFWNRQQLADGRMPRNSLLNGKPAPSTAGVQLDETAYPILETWQAGMASVPGIFSHHVEPAANYLVAHGPKHGVDRWEEQTGYSPNTIAAEIAGLVAAAKIATLHHDSAAARLYLATADEFQRTVVPETVTTNGPASKHPYFIRVSKNGNPNSSYSYYLGNGNPKAYDQRSVIDAGFLSLARLGELPQNAPVVANSLSVVDHMIRATTSSGSGFFRYNGDGYGNTFHNGHGSSFGDSDVDGQPWATNNTGTGGLWPVLSGERGEHALAVGDWTGPNGADAMLSFMLGSASGVGLVPEQVWPWPNLAASPYGANPSTASIGFRNGYASGSASPLTWAQSQLVRLILDMGAKRVLEQPSIVANRYVTHSQAQTPLQVSAPVSEAGSSVFASRPVATVSTLSTTVTGTTAPGSSVEVSVTDISAAGQPTTLHTTTADSAGRFALTVPLGSGTNAVAVAANAPDGATNEALFQVVSLAIPGTRVIDVAGPSNGGHGPGNFAYPTSSAFVPGAFHITDFKVIDSGSTVSFQVGVSNLNNPFGGTQGFSLQLVDLYIRRPGQPSSDYTTAPIYPSRNYTIAPADAWNQVIEVDGYGRAIWQNASGSGVGNISSVSGTSADNQITITVPTSALGTPGPGWVFTVSLWGQDGFATNDARPITATPGAYSFGVCSASQASASPEPAVCKVTPANEPEVMDTVPPPGVNVTSELNLLDYPGNTTSTVATPVRLQGVTVP